MLKIRHKGTQYFPHIKKTNPATTNLFLMRITQTNTDFAKNQSISKIHYLSCISLYLLFSCCRGLFLDTEALFDGAADGLGVLAIALENIEDATDVVILVLKAAEGSDVALA